MNKLLFTVALLSALFIASYLYSKYRVAPKVKFKNLSLTDLQGRAVSLDSYAGKNLFISFFATWCPPCVREIPALIAADKILASEQFRFILISEEPIETLLRFKERLNVPLLILHSNQKLAEQNIVTMPTNYVLNPAHEIVYTKVGEADWASAEIIEMIKSKVR